MAKRGRPRKTAAWRPADADAYVIKALQDKVAELTEERDIARKGSQERYEYGLMLSKQLEQAEERNKELLAEIRMYEHETALLRHIIIDALRQKD